MTDTTAPASRLAEGPVNIVITLIRLLYSLCVNFMSYSHIYLAYVVQVMEVCSVVAVNPASSYEISPLQCSIWVSL